MKLEHAAGIGAFAAVAGAVALGFATIGSPQHVRLVELDHRRLSDLQTIAYELHVDGMSPAAASRVLPARAPAGWPHDPLTGKPYGYRRGSPTRYRVCATFALPSEPDDAAPSWRHPAGPACFRFDATAPPPSGSPRWPADRAHVSTASSILT